MIDFPGLLAYAYVRVNEGTNKIGKVMQVLTFAGVYTLILQKRTGWGEFESVFFLSMSVFLVLLLAGEAYIRLGFFDRERMSIAAIDPIMMGTISEKERRYLALALLPVEERNERIERALREGKV